MLSCIATLEYTAAPIAILLSAISLVLTGQPLTPSVVFLILSYINVLKQSVCTDLAQGFLKTYEAYVSLSRIEDYLLLENLPLTSSNRFSKKKGYVEKSPVIMGNPQNSLVDFTKAMYDKKSDSQNDRETQETNKKEGYIHITRCGVRHHAKEFHSGHWSSWQRKNRLYSRQSLASCQT